MMAVGALRKTLAFSLLVVVVLALGVGVGATCFPSDMPVAQDVSSAPAICPHSDSILQIKRRIAEVENSQDAAFVAVSERIVTLSDSVSVGLIDVACLYRSHVLLTHHRSAARAVRDKPAPGAWIDGRLSHLWPSELTMAECARRMAP